MAFRRRDDRVTLRVEQGQHVQFLIRGGVTLRLRADTDQDRRLAMVLGRLLCDEETGKPVLAHQQIADAFDRKSRQESHHHHRAFGRAGGSLAQMVLTGARRGRPTKVHPTALARIASYWERDPLAGIDETRQWLAASDLPADVPLPTVDEIRFTDRIEGDLLRIRSSIRRLFERRADGIVVRSGVLLDRLLEVVELQNRKLRDAGLESMPVPAIVDLALGDAPSEPRSLSTTGRALADTLRELAKPLSAEEDEPLSASIRQRNLFPFYCGALYCSLRLSVSQVAALVGRSKSVVYRGLVTLERSLDALDLFSPAGKFSGVLGLDEKWLRIPKSFSAEERQEGKRWRYAHFAVDAATGDLLHVDVFETADANAVRVFLAAVRAKGIRPKIVVTDMLAAYGRAITDIFGTAVKHHYCLFHHLQAVRHRLREKCGAKWKDQPLLRQLVERIDHIYDCRDRRTAKKRLAKVLALREELEHKHPEAVSLLEILEERFPFVANAIGRSDVPTTNNITERTIKAFARHYKNMAGLESIETARIQLRLFRFFYRLTPMSEPVNPEHRGKCPLERAGWSVRGVPIADCIRRFTCPQLDEPDDLPTRSEPTPNHRSAAIDHTDSAAANAPATATPPPPS